MTLYLDLPLQDDHPNNTLRTKVGNYTITVSNNTDTISQSGPGGYCNKSILLNSSNPITISPILGVFPGYPTNSAISFWAKYTGTASIQNSNLDGLILTSNTISIFESNGNSAIISVSPTIDLTQWNHYIINQTGTSLNCYVNNVAVGNGSRDGSWDGFDFEQILFTGTNLNLAGLRLYNAPLNSDERTADYNLGLTSQTVSTDIYPAKFFSDTINYSQVCVFAGNTTFDVDKNKGNIDLNNIKNKYNTRFKHNIPPNE